MKESSKAAITAAWITGLLGCIGVTIAAIIGLGLPIVQKWVGQAELTPVVIVVPATPPQPVGGGIAPDTPTFSPILLNTPVPSTDASIPIASSPDVQPSSTLGPSFGKMSFCLERDFNLTARRCKVSQELFAGPVKCVYVSWTYNNVYVGMIFSRKWYWNNELILSRENESWDGNDWKIDGVSEYTFLKSTVFGSGQEYLRPGTYTVELYIGDRLEQRSDFIIQ